MPLKQAIGIVSLLLFAAGTASGQFTTVINLPGDPAPSSIGPGTQLNIFDGGRLGPPLSSFTAMGGEVNVSGGTISVPSFVSTGDATVNVSGGHFTRNVTLDGTSRTTITGGLVEGDGWFRWRGQSRLEISGGEFHHPLEGSGNSRAEISGGRMLGTLSLRDSAEAALSGGLFVSADHSLSLQSSLLLKGGDFRIDGVPVGGLSMPGSQQQVQLEPGQYISATLADGSPFVLGHNGRGDPPAIMLEAAPIPAAPVLLTLPGMTPPHALRDGQTLNLGPGGQLGSHFVAGWNSTLNVDGGQIDPLLRAYGANIHIKEGKIGAGFRAERSTVLIEGGAFSDAHFSYGSVVDISGGSFSELRINQSTTLTLRDGAVGTVAAAQGRIHMVGGHIAGEVHLTSASRFTLEGGLLSGPMRIFRSVNDVQVLGGTIAGPVTVGQAGQLHIRGGSFTDRLLVQRDADLTIYGTHFALPPTGDGPEIDLTNILEPNVPYLLEIRDTTLTATLADGSPFELDLFTFPVPGHDFVDPAARVYLVLVQIPEPGTLLFALSLVPLVYLARGRGKRPRNF